ncbi:MAG: beta-lactamase family protein [Hyphomonadaceae bacterium]|nr:beta-lactamase family protein [Hyphomonadaceae bacterium]
MANKFAALALGLTLITLPAAAQEDGPPRPQLPPLALNAQMTNAEIGAALDPWLAGLQRDGVFNGALLVARDGREIYARAYGTRDMVTNSALSIDDRFPLASIGKAFTHVAIAQLIQAGRLTPETTIADVLPDYPNATTRTATVAQLLNHEAGVADIFGPAFRDMPKDRLTNNHSYYELVSRQPPTFAPGAGQEYCNGCYVVLGEMIERLTQRPYESYIADHVFAPAGMTRSAFLRYDQSPADAAHFTGRPMGPGTPLQDVSRFHGVAGSAAGNAYSTLRDLLAFDNALREHRLLGPDLTAQVLRGQPEADRATARIGFAGGSPGVNTLLFGNGAWTVVVLTNFDEPNGETIGSAVFPLLAGPRPQ